MNDISQLSVNSRLTFDVLQFGAIPEISALCFSPDGRWLCGICKGLVRIWAMPSGELAHEFNSGGQIAFTPNSDLVCIFNGQDFSLMRILRLPDGKLVREFEIHREPIYTITVSPDGSTIAGGGYQKAYLWDVGSGQQTHSFPLHRRVTNFIGFAPNGQSLVTRSYNDAAIWSLDGELQTAIEPLDEGFGAVAASPQGVLAVTNNNAVELWNWKGERLAYTETEHRLYSAAFDATGEVLVVGSCENDITIFDVESLKITRTLKTPRPHVHKLAWSADGTLAAVCYGAIELWSDRAIGKPSPKAAARADDAEMTERLERIRAKIAKRGLGLLPPAELSQVEAFEAEWKITLPLGFRRFITEIGNGGNGPPAYGLVRLQESAQLYNQSLQPQKPFPFTEDFMWTDEDAAKFYPDEGYLYLGTDGCAMDWILIIEGTERGQIWQVTEMGAVAVAPRRDLLSWYEYWIDGGDDYWEMFGDGAA